MITDKLTLKEVMHKLDQTHNMQEAEEIVKAYARQCCDYTVGIAIQNQGFYDPYCYPPEIREEIRQ